MKDYHSVVQERFDQESEESIRQSIYSDSHPIGRYSQARFFQALDQLIQELGPIRAWRILDLGCGHGDVLSYFAQQGARVDNLTGIDFSAGRIERAKKRHKNITFLQGDATQFDLENQTFDLITCFDLFSHLSTKEEIFQALDQIRKHLEKGGYFLWYDMHSRDHFSPPPHTDSHGFNGNQMIRIAAEKGFSLRYKKGLYRLFFGRYHSIYQAGRIPSVCLRLLERIIPGPVGNHLMVFELNKD